MGALEQFDALRNVNFSLSGTATDGGANADAIPATDVSMARWVSLHLLGNSFSGTLTFQGSNDGVNWVNVALANIGLTGSGSYLATSQTNGAAAPGIVYAGGIHYRWFRARVTAYTSGSISVYAEFSALPGAQFLVGTLTQGGAAHGATDTGNPVKVGGKASDSAPSVVANGQRADAWSDRRGRLMTTAALATDTLTNAGAEVTPQFAAIVASASGVTAVVAADGTRKIRALGYTLAASGAVNAKFQGGSNDKTGLLYLGANDSICVPFSPIGWFETAVNEALNLNLSGAVAVGGHLAYALV